MKNPVGTSSEGGQPERRDEPDHGLDSAPNPIAAPMTVYALGRARRPVPANAPPSEPIASAVHQQAELAGAGLEDHLGQYGQGEVEVEPDQADHEQQREREHQVVALPDVAQPVADAGVGQRADLAVQVVDPHPDQQERRCEVGDRVEQEDRPGADKRDGHTGQGRPQDPGGVEDGRRQRQRVGQQLAGHQFGDERPGAPGSRSR